MSTRSNASPADLLSNSIRVNAHPYATTFNMSDEFDDDDVFDDVDVDQVLESSQAPAPTLGKRRSQGSKDQAGGELSDDDVFDGVDVDDILQSSQVREDDEHRSKRARIQNDESPAQDEENVALARRLLKEKFGYHAFRHEQEGAIRRILAGKHALVIFPTGAGKSLCYQIPGIAFSELDKARGLREPGQSGITIVISPLIALMKDQVDVLKRRGIAADCIDSTKTWDQLQEINQKLARGELQIIYCSPERLNNERFVESMKYVQGGVRLVAVDEAHCISEWGHSFRPEYLKVARFVGEIKAERVICLTATATARVAEDICRAFAIDRDAGVFQTIPYRPNLNLYAESVDIPSQKLPKLCQYLEKHPGPTLIYVTRQIEAEELAAYLKDEDFNAAAFHAGMKVEDKTKIQDDFMADRVLIVVATIAFGMGVDKANIRNIVHYTLPSTLEEYSQQVGRAGRDGKSSTCMLYLCNSDFWIRENFARGDLPSYRPFRKLLEDIFDDEVTRLRVGETFKKNTNEQMKEFDIRQSPLSVIYATLELHFNLIRAITPEYSEYQWEITEPGLYHGITRNMKNSDRPEAAAILMYATRKTKWTYLDVNQVVRDTGYLRANIIQILDHLDRDGIIRLTAKGVTPKFRVLQKLPKTDTELDELAKKMYADLEQKEKDALHRTQEVVGFVTGAKCFALSLAQHFGMSLPDQKEECGHCTFCETKQVVKLPPKAQRPLDRARVMQVLADCPVRDDPRFLARVAFGILSPRVRTLKMHQTSAWESMVDQDFDELLREFTTACKAAKYEPYSQNLQSNPGGRALARSTPASYDTSSSQPSGRARGRGSSSRGLSGRGSSSRGS